MDIYYKYGSGASIPRAAIGMGIACLLGAAGLGHGQEWRPAIRWVPPRVSTPALRVDERVAAHRSTADKTSAPEPLTPPEPDHIRGVTQPTTAPTVQHTEKSMIELTVDTRTSAGELPRNPASVVFAEEGVILDGMGVQGEANPWRYSLCNPAFGFCHSPLYFEQFGLECRGYSYGICNPLVSAAHFFGSLSILPCKMLVIGPRDHVSSVDRSRRERKRR